MLWLYKWNDEASLTEVINQQMKRLVSGCLFLPSSNL